MMDIKHEISNREAMTAINIENLEYTWQGESDPILRIPQFVVKTGESVFLRGASGSGKSTLLNLISGILPAAPGCLHVLGTDMAGLSMRKRDAFRAKHIGVVFQQFNLVPFLTVGANLRLAGRFTSQPQQETKAYSLELISALQLKPDVLEKRADRLSIGQQQRVAIARAFINKPEIVLADEPTSALDANSRDQFVELLLSIRQSTGCAVVFVSHDDSLAKFFDTNLALADLNKVSARQVANV